jgi:condensin complex subunit 3
MDVDDDEDSLLNGLQGEGTRMPLDAGESEEEEEEDEESTPRATRPTREEQLKTEMDIMDELLASEDEDEEMTM